VRGDPNSVIIRRNGLFRVSKIGLDAVCLETVIEWGEEREKQSPCVEYISSAAVGLFFEIFEQRHHITQSALEPFLRRGRLKGTIFDQS
jgi:hypothetical protein